MPNYIIAYHAGKNPPSPEDGANQKAKWQAWIEGLGENAVNPGTPLGPSRTVSAEGVTDNGGPNPLTGFSIVKADDMDAALEIAKACPFLAMGTVEVAQVMGMG